MRVVYLNPCGQMGGAETSLVELLASVRRIEPQWDLSLVLGDDGSLAATARALGVRVHVEPMPAALARAGDSGSSGYGTKLAGAAAAAGYLRRLAGAVRAQKPDLIHSTGFKMHLLSAWVVPRRIPILWHVHDYVRSRPMMSRLIRRHAHRCSVAVANSRSVASDLRGVVGPRLRIETIYNAIDPERFSPEGPVLDLDALSGLPPAEPGTIRVGLAATFAHWKGHHTFLEALSTIPSRAPLRGYVIGGPIYQTKGSQHTVAALREASVRLGLEGRIGFTGFIPDTARAMRALDIVVHASTAPEPFGMVIAEGMACGKAVVASRAGGAQEIFEDGIDALSHPPGDAAVLAQRILRLALDPDLRNRLGRAGAAKIRARFEGSRLAGELTSIYRDCWGRAIAGVPRAMAAHG